MIILQTVVVVFYLFINMSLYKKKSKKASTALSSELQVFADSDFATEMVISSEHLLQAFETTHLSQTHSDHTRTSTRLTLPMFPDLDSCVSLFSDDYESDHIIKDVLVDNRPCGEVKLHSVIRLLANRLYSTPNDIKWNSLPGLYLAVCYCNKNKQHIKQ